MTPWQEKDKIKGETHSEGPQFVSHLNGLNLGESPLIWGQEEEEMAQARPEIQRSIVPEKPKEVFQEGRGGMLGQILLKE